MGAERSERGPIGGAEPPRRHVRSVREGDLAQPHPLYVVWEITLRCDLGCRHCGSRAGKARDDELDTLRALETVDELAELGVREVTLIGGEAYLREDWDVIARAITDRGMTCGLTTGARGLNAERVARAEAAGVRAVSVSIDGLEDTHDAQRNVKGAFRSAIDALARLSKTSIRAGCNTQINRLSMPELHALGRRLVEAGMRAWQIQLTVPMGNAADRPRLLLQPYELLALYPWLVHIERSVMRPAGATLYPGNNLGYFTPFEGALRYGGSRGAHWGGCPAGEWSLGLEADGKVKACPSLPSEGYTGGMLGERPLAEMVREAPEITALARRTRADLWGRCGDCYYADVCKAGCSWTAQVFFGRPGNNPYCIHRALELEREGRCERLDLVEAAPGRPFDQGRYSVTEEDLPDVSPTLSGFDLDTCLQLEPSSAGIWSPEARADILRARTEHLPTRGLPILA